MEQSLRGMLESLPAVDVVGSAAGCLSALQMVREKQADLVVIDSNLQIEDVLAFLQQLKQQGLPTLSLVLTATKSQTQRALAAGADATVRRDGPSGQLSATVTKLSGASQVGG
jgi:DNA-binding NarL/FixJ family response regulator